MKTIQQIKKTPLSKRIIEEEYHLARQEKRQPCCVYCGELLEIDQTQYDYISWIWNEETKSYTKSSGGDADKPYCHLCGAKDRDFIDEDLVSY